VAAVRLTIRSGDRLHEVEIERSDAHFRVVVDGTEHLVDARKLEADFYSILMEGRSYEVSVEPEGDRYHVRHGAAKKTVTLTDAARAALDGLRATGSGPESVVTVMPGKVVRVLVKPGDEVSAGQGLVVVEAMKMENEIGAPRDGRVTSVAVEPGRAVEAGATLLVIE
jgi:biotin carboxyl carrier protein